MRQMRGHPSRHRNRARDFRSPPLRARAPRVANPDRLLRAGRQGHADIAAYCLEGFAGLMKPRDTISAAINAGVGRGRPALVGFLTAGFPNRRQFKDNLVAVLGACDVVEIGVPFSDPMADGTTIQRASFVALSDGVTLPWILEELESFRERLPAPVLLMSYLNPLLKPGLDALPRAAAAAGVAGFIVPDL